jgi:hypothetical protein
MSTSTITNGLLVVLNHQPPVSGLRSPALFFRTCTPVYKIKSRAQIQLKVWEIFFTANDVGKREIGLTVEFLAAWPLTPRRGAREMETVGEWRIVVPRDNVRTLPGSRWFWGSGFRGSGWRRDPRLISGNPSGSRCLSERGRGWRRLPRRLPGRRSRERSAS